jgi:hypothetical protein
VFSSFNKSDIIIASPLGVKLLEENYFFSSIEILVVDRASVIRMQNWEHLEDAIK